MTNYGTANTYAWVDLETTDLDPDRGHILEIAVIITRRAGLEELERMHIVVHQPPDVLARMSDWGKSQHGTPRPEAGGKSLVQLSAASTVSLADAEALLGQLLDRARGRTRWILMAGASLMLDYAYLTKHMPSMKHRFHYRLCDVSGVMEFVKGFGKGAYLPPHTGNHTAMKDAEASLNLMRSMRASGLVGGVGVGGGVGGVGSHPHFGPPPPSGPVQTRRWGFDAAGGRPLQTLKAPVG